MKPKVETIRDLRAISLLNPLCIGDAVELDGPTGSNLWLVGRGAYGWYLHSEHSRLEVHPTIHDIDGMAEFLSAIFEHAKAY